MSISVGQFNIDIQTVRPLAAIFHVQVRDIGSLERLGPIYSAMGVNILTIAVLQDLHNRKPLYSLHEICEAMSNYMSVEHINARFGKYVKGVAASKVTYLVYCFAYMSSIVPGRFEQIDMFRIAEAAMTLTKEAIPAYITLAPVESLSIYVRQFNNLTISERAKHTRVKIRYASGSGTMHEIVCCPQCCTSEDCTNMPGCIHDGQIDECRLTKSSAASKKHIASWSCCGKIIVSSSPHPRGYDFGQPSECDAFD